METPSEWRTSPNKVSALEYVDAVIRANRESGLMIDPSHMYQVRDKLLDQVPVPRIRVLQMLNRLADAEKQGKPNIYLSVEDARVILEVAKEWNAI